VIGVEGVKAEGQKLWGVSRPKTHIRHIGAKFRCEVARGNEEKADKMKILRFSIPRQI